MEPVQWLVVWPLIVLMPARRRRVTRAWLQLQARLVLALARVVGGLRLTIEGAIPPTSCIVLMNHQSVLDIPVGVSLVRGPYPLIPTRASYRRAIPGISTLMRLSRQPLVSQQAQATRAEHRAITEASEQVARGEHSLILFPEGHRSTDGEMLPFMTSGLRRILGGVRQRPVYLAVVDGYWHLRTIGDAAFRLAGTSARVSILGPYTIPPAPGDIDRFIGFLRGRMIEALARGRAPAPEAHALAAAHHRLAH